MGIHCISKASPSPSAAKGTQCICLGGAYGVPAGARRQPPALKKNRIAGCNYKLGSSQRAVGLRVV